MNPGTSEEQERLIVGPFTLVPYFGGLKVNGQSDYWALPGCSKIKPRVLSTEGLMNIAFQHGYPIKCVKVQLYRRGDGI